VTLGCAPQEVKEEIRQRAIELGLPPIEGYTLPVGAPTVGHGGMSRRRRREVERRAATDINKVMYRRKH
jgi:hypothetical protein